MKNIVLLIIILNLLNCGPRKSNVYILKENISLKNRAVESIESNISTNIDSNI